MSTLLLLSAAVQSTSDDGLTLRELLDNLPSDPASIFTLLLLTVSVALVAWSGRRPRGKGGRPA